MTGLVIGSMLDRRDLPASNATKIHHGGWFPLVMGLTIFTMLITWRRGRSLMFHRLSEQGIPLKPFLDSLRMSPPTKVEGTAIFMTSSTTAVPHALLHNLKHNRVLHDKTVFLTIVTHDVPVVPPEDRVQYERLGEGFYRLEAWYGFKEQPDIDDLNSCRVRYGLSSTSWIPPSSLRETVVPSRCRAWRGGATIRVDVAQRDKATDFNIPRTAS